MIEELVLEDSKSDILLQQIIKDFGISKIRLINELLDPNIKVYINIGRYDKQKGHDRLISAFERFNKQFPNSRLVIVAPYGPIKEETRSQVANSTANENIYLFSRMNNPYTLLKMADAFVFSSYYEGLGLVVYEALALDKQVITVNLPATIRYLNGDEVIVVDNSEQGLYEGFVSFQNGKRANSNFSFEQYNKKTINEFEALFDLNK
ncbi:glycosyltransferase [Heyndrickxia sporothermodurans]|uniref:glycosyltransferase n=1 Tax=Heyndrickxia sporothermodurans TaxID=46224 RepID=UPI003D231A7A